MSFLNAFELSILGDGYAPGYDHDVDNAYIMKHGGETTFSQSHYNGVFYVPLYELEASPRERCQKWNIDAGTLLVDIATRNKVYSGNNPHNTLTADMVEKLGGEETMAIIASYDAHITIDAVECIDAYSIRLIGVVPDSMRRASRNKELPVSGTNFAIAIRERTKLVAPYRDTLPIYDFVSGKDLWFWEVGTACLNTSGVHFIQL